MALSLVTGTGQASNCAAQTPLYPTTASYVVDKDEPGESTLKNVVGTIDQPNVIRFAVSSVTDIFKGTSVLPISGQSTEGLSILMQVQERWKIDDAADSLPSLYYPVSAHTVIKLPVDALVTPAVIAALYLRLMGAPFRSGAATLADSLTPLLHGVARF